MAEMKKEDVLRYLSDTRSHYASYHNHKEVSAWTGIVLFAALIPQTVTYLGGPAGTCGLGVIETLAVLALLALALIFVSKQFESREFAADVVAASFALTAEILHKKEEEIAVLDFSVESSSDKDKQAPYVLAKVLLR